MLAAGKPLKQETGGSWGRVLNTGGIAIYITAGIGRKSSKGKAIVELLRDYAGYPRDDTGIATWSVARRCVELCSQRAFRLKRN
jgi:hypothetical protein